MKRINKKSGFTLVELIVVIVIILVLATLLVPNILKYIHTASRARCVEDRHSIATELLSDYVLNDEIPETNGEIEIPETMNRHKCPSGGTYTAVYEDGNINITCDVHDEGENGASNGNSGYKPAVVAESAVKYKVPLNTVLQTLYDSIVANRLQDDTNHISYVLFKDGKVTDIQCYDKENWKTSQAKPGISDQEKAALNEKIKKALESADTGYQISANQAGRIYFDWAGNVITGLDAAGKPLGIGGQYINASIKFSTDGGNRDSATIGFIDENVGWDKLNK